MFYRKQSSNKRQNLKHKKNKVVIVDREFNIKPENPRNFTPKELNTLRTLELNERR